MILQKLLGLSKLDGLKDDLMVLYYALLTITILHAFLIPFFYFLGIPQISILNVFSLCVYLYAIQLFYQSIKTSNFNAIAIIISLEVILHAYFVCYFIGIESGFQYYIFGLAAFPFVFVKKTLIVNALRILTFVFFFIVLEVSMKESAPRVVLSSSLLELIRFSNITLLLLLVGSITLAYSQATQIHQETLAMLASTDKLTGIDNRRSLMTKADAEIMKSNISGEPLSMLLIDIDHFKIINDTYGHVCGDYILSNITNVMKSVLRKQDVFGRWGGEEFMVLLPNANETTLGDLAERLRLVVEQTVFSYQGKPISVSVTIGAATLVKKETFDSITTRADLALYEGKQSGRNIYRYAAA